MLKWVEALQDKVEQNNRLLRRIMSLVQVEQTDLDGLSTELGAVADSLATEITNLESKVGQPLSAADLSGLNAAKDRLAALETPVVAPPAS